MFNTSHESETAIIKACGAAQIEFFGELKIPETRTQRYTGKDSDAEVMCRGGVQAVQFRNTPWVDWSNYWGTGGVESLPKAPIISDLRRNRGVTGALFDLERQRVALIEFNLFDNSGTYPGYVNGVDGQAETAIKEIARMSGEGLRGREGIKEDSFESVDFPAQTARICSFPRWPARKTRARCGSRLVNHNSSHRSP
jgi:hypothetical protein